MERIPKVQNDPTLNALIDGIERHHGREILQSDLNRYVDIPHLFYLAFTHVGYTTASVASELGGVTEDTLANPRLMDQILYVEARVGNERGQGIGYDAHPVSLKGGIKSLGDRVDMLINGSSEGGLLKDASDSYDDFMKEAKWDNSVCVPNLANVTVERYEGDLSRSKKKKIATKKLRDLAKKCSKILSQDGNDGRVQIDIHDETRRLVTSEGAVIRDGFFGYRFKFTLGTRGGNKNSPMFFKQNIYFTEESTAHIEREALRVASWVFREAQKRKKGFVEVRDGLYPVLFSQAAMSTQLHECFVHLLAGDEILEDSTSLGWENYGRMVTNPKISVYSDPGMPGKWGSMEFDHEGVKAQRRKLIERGAVKGYLADRNSAYHLSRKLGVEILPGDARIPYPSSGDEYNSQPRISNLEVKYHGRNMPKSQKEMFRRFVKYLRSNKIERGIWIPDGSGAGCVTEEGIMEASPNFPYIVTADGRRKPTMFVKTLGNVHSFLDDIVIMGGPEEYEAHRCGVGGNTLVRAGISCGTGIVKKVHINLQRPEEYRQ